MIGDDYYWSFVKNVVRGEAGDGPVAISTRLGYVFSGPLNLNLSEAVSSNLSIAHTMKTECVTLPKDSPTDLLLKEDLNKFWDYESLGIKDGENDMYNNYLKTIKRNEHRYEVPLPLKLDHPVIPDNYISARCRLTSQVRKLKSSPAILREYDRVIKEQLHTGVIEEVQEAAHVQFNLVLYII